MSEENSDLWQIDEAGLSVGSHLAISFQRYPLPEGGVLMSPSPSFGALPIGRSAGGALLLPLAATEACWLGFSNYEPSQPIEVGVAVETSTGAVLDAVTGAIWDRGGDSALRIPPQSELDGISRSGGGWWPLARVNPHPQAPQCRALQIVVRLSSTELSIARIEAIDSSDFDRQTNGRSPPPLDPTAVYGGWLLP